MSHIDRAAEALSGIEVWIAFRDEAGDDAVASGTLEMDDLRKLTTALDAAGLLVTPAHDAKVAAKAWDEGFKQGGPMHDVDLNDPDAHTRNPYREGGDDA